MKVLVTGGCGFIGSNLVDKLVDLGHDVIVIDNLSSMVHDQFYFNDKAKYYHLDVADFESTEALYSGVDTVFHLAGESRIQISIDNPLKAVRTNALGSATVVEASRKHGVRRIVYSSTSSSYGLKNKVPLTEDMPKDCLNTYSVTKSFGEEFCAVYTRMYGIETIILRYFNVYGDREPLRGPYAPVIGLFIRQAKAGQPLTIVGDGEQRRDFTHINDVVQANILAMDAKLENYGQIFNIGNGKNYSINEIADMISDKREPLPLRIGEARETLANNNKARTLLGWKPVGNIKDYIEDSMKDIK